MFSAYNYNSVVFLFQHRDTPDNNPDIPFEFTEENKKVRLTSGLSSRGRGRTNVFLIESLH